MAHAKHLSSPLHDSGWRVWFAIAFLGIGAFTIVTTELAPVGLLSPIALDLARSEATVGLTVTVYAWIGAISALCSALWLGRVPRKPLLIALMLGLALSNAGTVLADSFAALLSVRVLGAISHGLFWAVIGATAARIAPMRHMGLATSIVFGGVSAASVVGVPLATLIGQSSGWRWAFGAIGALSLLTALGLAAVLPKFKTQDAVGRAALAAVWGRRDLLGIFVATAFAVTAHFAAFTFIEPLLRSTPAVGAGMVAALLFGFGAAGLLGNVLTGLFIDRFLAPLLMLSLVAMSLALVVLGRFGPVLGMAGVAAVLLVWGAAIAAIFVGLQTWILRSAGTSAVPASAVYVAIFNAAIGSGALAGAWIYSRAGLPMVLTAAAVAGALAIVVVGVLGRSRREGDEQLKAA